MSCLGFEPTPPMTTRTWTWCSKRLSHDTSYYIYIIIQKFILQLCRSLTVALRLHLPVETTELGVKISAVRCRCPGISSTNYCSNKRGRKQRKYLQDKNWSRTIDIKVNNSKVILLTLKSIYWAEFLGAIKQFCFYWARFVCAKQFLCLTTYRCWKLLGFGLVSP